MSYFGVIFPLRSKTTKRLHANHSNSMIFNDALRISRYRLLFSFLYHIAITNRRCGAEYNLLAVTNIC